MSLMISIKVSRLRAPRKEERSDRVGGSRRDFEG
jgi:hypothetical protein